MDLRQQLICVADAFCLASGMSKARLSTIVLSGGKRLQRIEEGGDLGTARFESVMRWLSANWPAEAEWPASVPRPGVTVPEAAE